MNDKPRNKPPILVANVFAEDILNLSDEELLQEAQEELDQIMTNTTSSGRSRSNYEEYDFF